jgi:hypothetical protein
MEPRSYMPTGHDTDRKPWRKRAVLWGLLALSLVASLPGLAGSWIHDDINMLDNPKYDGIDDALSVFARHSGSYDKRKDSAHDDNALVQTYRPVTAFTLVATHALAPVPWLHHLIGWLLHVATAWLLGLVLRRIDDRDSSRAAQLFVVGLFLLHPVGVESYVWINGRSDLVAGLCLAALLWVLCSQLPVGQLSAAVFALTALGSAAKETFAPAALLVSIAFAVAPHVRSGPARLVWRQRAWLVIAASLGIALYLVARWCVLPGRSASLAHAGNPFAEAATWAFLPKLAAIVSYALLSLRAANMQSLGWDAVRDLSWAEWGCGLLAVAALVALVRGRDWRAVLLVAAAAACLAPTVFVASAIWLGLDRYLYMPLILLLVVAYPYVVAAAAAVQRNTPRLAPLMLTGILGVAAANTFVASRAYADQATWLATLAQERPNDPTIIAFLANELGQPQAGLLMQRFPPPPWPSSVIAPVIAHALASGQTGLAQRAAEYGVVHYPKNALIAALAFRMRYLSGQHARALALLPRLELDVRICAEVQKQLGVWAARSLPADRERLTAAMHGMRCPAVR